MRKIFFCFLFSCIAISLHSQDSTGSKNVERYKGLQLVYVNLTGNGFLVTGAASDYQFLVEIIPSYAYYFSKSVEGILQYHFSYLKYASQNPTRNDIFNQFLVALHYYPLKKPKFLYTEIGFSYGNYFLEKETFNQRKEWGAASYIGFGIELLTKRKLTLHFNAAVMVPFSSKYNTDFIRSVGIGIQLIRKRR